MTLEEVSVTAGGRPMTYVFEQHIWFDGARGYWLADDADLVVGFDADGRAFEVEIRDPPPSRRRSVVRRPWSQLGF